jgi:hypothetical protein
MDVEDNAYQQGIHAGETTIPIPILRNNKLDIRVCYEDIERQIISSIHPFLIHTQASRLDETIKRKYYTDSFLKGFWVGYSKVSKQFKHFQCCVQDVLLEWGRRKGGLYLSYYLENHPSRGYLVDLNLIPMIRKFVQ